MKRPEETFPAMLTILGIPTLWFDPYSTGVNLHIPLGMEQLFESNPHLITTLEGLAVRAIEIVFGSLSDKPDDLSLELLPPGEEQPGWQFDLSWTGDKDEDCSYENHLDDPTLKDSLRQAGIERIEFSFNAGGDEGSMSFESPTPIPWGVASARNPSGISTTITESGLEERLFNELDISYNNEPYTSGSGNLQWDPKAEDYLLNAEWVSSSTDQLYESLDLVAVLKSAQEKNQPSSPELSSLSEE